MDNTPFIGTPRLLLRPFTSDDAAALFRYASDSEFARYLSYDAPAREADAAAFIGRALAGEAGANLWAITLLAAPEVVGAVQLDVESPGVASLHYEIARWLWGQGLASEAVGAVLAWASVAHPELSQLRADVAADNVASRRILEKFGLSAVDEEDGVVRYEGPFVIEVAPTGVTLIA